MTVRVASPVRPARSARRPSTWCGPRRRATRSWRSGSGRPWTCSSSRRRSSGRRVVAVADPARRAEVAAALPFATVVDRFADLVEPADVVVNAVVGFAGLPVTIATLEQGKRLALANKESLIAAGPVVQPLRATPGAELVPVDSEHCAVHQCLRSSVAVDREVARVLLTASGGPFRGRTAAELADVDRRRGAGPSDLGDGSEDHHRLEHADEQGPGGDRGPRAVRRRLRPDRGRRAPPVGGPLDGRVHRRLDGRPAQPARHAAADRLRPRVPGADRHALRPHRLGPARIARRSSRPTWPRSAASTLCYQAGRAGGSAPAWLSAANEVAVDAFLAGEIRWDQIADVCIAALDRHDAGVPTTVDEVVAADRAARSVARRRVQDMSAR